MVKRGPGVSTGSLSSVAVHLFGLAALLVFARHRPFPRLAVQLPGTPQGQHLQLTYTTGSPAPSPAASAVPSRRAAADPSKASLPKPVTKVQEQTAASPAAPVSEPGVGTGGNAAFGTENVRVALPQSHPRPIPDLSSLAHGVGGDVIVDVAIDDTGKVTATTLVRGLGGSIDTTVMQVLHDWTFTPATRNGQNIASEQEIIVHYERG